MHLNITAPPLLNKVDQVIKSVMLTYPVPYKSRMSVLKRIFLDGNSFGWEVAGSPNLSYFGTLASEMEFSDLVEQRKKIDAELARDSCPVMGMHFAGRAVAIKRQYSDRELVAQYIDILAIEHTQGERSPMNAALVDGFCVGQNVLHEAPFDTMDKDWAFAAEEVITAARDGIVRNLGMQFGHFSPEHADPRLLQIHGLLTEYLVQLDRVTGTKAELAERNEIAERLIDQILAEENLIFLS